MNFIQRFLLNTIVKSVNLKDALAILFPSATSNQINSYDEAIKKSYWIYRAIAAVSQRFASVPFKIVNSEGERNEKIEEEIMYSNPDFTFPEILEKCVAQEVVWGYHPWYVESKVITPLDSNWIIVEKTNNGEYRYTPTVNFNASLNYENIVIFPNFTPYNSMVGISELQTCIDVVNLGENAIDLTNNILINGGIPPGVLTANRDLRPEEIDAIDMKWKERYGGSRGGRPAILGPSLSYQKIGLSPSDFSALDITKITLDGVSIAFGVPKFFLMNNESVDYANSRSQERALYQITILPKAERFASRMTRFVLPLMGYKGYRFKFDWSQIEALQEDRLTKAQADKIYLEIGKTYINELRARDGENELPWGNQWWGSITQGPLAEVSRPKTVSLSTEVKDDLITEVLKKIVNYKNKKPAQEIKEKIWNMFVQKTEPQEKRLIKEINKFFKKLKNDVLKQLENKKAIQKFSIEDIVSINIPEEARENLMNLLKPYLLAFMQQAGDSTMTEYGFGISFNLQIPEIQKWLKWKLENSASEIIKTTQADLYDLFLDGVNEGLSIPEIADKIEHLFEETYKHRAETIARTEVISVNNKATLEGLRQAGVKTKTWLTAIDERTREWHVEADGQTVGIDEPFVVNNEELDFPGDPKGSPENIINCRCTVVWNGEE